MAYPARGERIINSSLTTRERGRATRCGKVGKKGKSKRRLVAKYPQKRQSRSSTCDERPDGGGKISYGKRESNRREKEKR